MGKLKRDENGEHENNRLRLFVMLGVKNSSWY